METRAAAGFGSLFEGAGTRPSRVVLGALFFLFVFVLGGLGMGRGLESVPGLRLEEQGMAAIKARHMEEHRDEYDLVFIGSSRVYRQIKPTLFDAECARMGVPMKSYNMGLAGMRFYESVRAVERLMEDPPARLRTIVLEGMHPYPVLREENLLSRREIGWHTPGMTLLALRRVWDAPRPIEEKLRETVGHLFQFGCAFTSLGAGGPLQDVLLGRPRAEEDRTPGGFLPLEMDPSNSVTQRRRDFLEALNANRSLLSDRVAELEREPRRDAPDELLHEVLEHLEAITSAQGVELLFLILPPAESLRPELLAARDRGWIGHLLSYADPKEYPDFYLKLADRFDMNHLKKKGASRLTRLVAADVARELGGAPGR